MAQRSLLSPRLIRREIKAAECARTDDLVENMIDEVRTTVTYERVERELRCTHGKWCAIPLLWGYPILNEAVRTELIARAKNDKRIRLHMETIVDEDYVYATQVDKSFRIEMRITERE